MEITTIPYYITREYIQAHPDWNFIHSTNFWNNQTVGPAAICAGLDNCYGVPVRWRLCKSSGYFQDAQREEIIKQIDKMIDVIPLDKPLIPFPKLGNGDSRMYVFAPIAYAHLKKRLDAITMKVARDYTT